MLAMNLLLWVDFFCLLFFDCLAVEEYHMVKRREEE